MAGIVATSGARETPTMSKNVCLRLRHVLLHDRVRRFINANHNHA